MLFIFCIQKRRCLLYLPKKLAGLTSNSRSDIHVTHQTPTKKALSLQVSLWCLAHLLQSMTNPQPLDADLQNLSNALVHLLDEQSHIQTWIRPIVRCGCCLLVQLSLQYRCTSSTTPPLLTLLSLAHATGCCLSPGTAFIHLNHTDCLLKKTWPPSCVTITMPRFFGALNRRLKTSVHQKSYTPENEHGT